MSEDEAQKTLLDNLNGKLINEPRTIRFRTGRRLKQWNKNCVALGLASGFLEPLESTSIHLIQNNIIRLVKLFPAQGIEQSEVDQFNWEVKQEIEYIRDFIIAHYHVTQRADTEYWNDCREMQVPESLAHKLRLFKAGGKIFRDNNELFSQPSWVAVLIGQGLVPESYHPFVNNKSDEELRGLLAGVRAGITELVRPQPLHKEFIELYSRPPAG